MALRELLAQFDVKVDDAQLQAFNAKLEATIASTKRAQASWAGLQAEFAARIPKGISNVSGEMRNVEFAAQGAATGIQGALGGLLAAFGGARLVGMLRGVAHEAIATGSKIQDATERLGVGAEDLQRLAYAAEQTGGSFEGAGNALKFLSKNLADAKAGGSSAKVFADLGVKVTDATGAIRPALDIVSELGDSFAKMPAAERVGKAMEVFGRGGLDMIPILARGTEGVRQLTDELDDLGGVLNSRAVGALDDLGDEGLRVSKVFAGIRNRMVVDLAPGLLALMERVRGASVWLGRLLQNTNAAKIGVAAFAGGIAIMGVKAAQAFGFIRPVTSGFWGLARALFVSGAPLILWGLGLAAIALAAEDVYTWLTGGTSVIGQFLEKTYGTEEATKRANELRDSFHNIYAKLQELIPVAQETGITLLKWFPAVIDQALKLVSLVERAVGALGTLRDFGGRVLDEAGGGKAIAAAGQVSGAVQRRWTDVFGGGKAGETTINPGAQIVRDTNHSTAGYVPRTEVLTSGQAGPGTTNVQQKNEINVTVQGGADAKATGRTIATFVRDATTDANNRAAAAAIDAGY